MGLRKTILALVFGFVKEHLRKTSAQSTDLLIAQFFNKFYPLDQLNRHLKQQFDNNVHQRYFLRVLFLKVLLPIDVLRSLHLFPPKGVDLDLWVCLASPCSSSDKYKCQNIKLIETIRHFLRHDDGLPEGYYQTFEKTWGDQQRQRPLDQNKKRSLESFSPLILFPVKSLPLHVKRQILKLHDRGKEIGPVLDHLFLCPDHFGAKPGVKLELKLRSDTIFNYSFEYIHEILSSGQAVIRPGRKGLRHLPFLPTLISRCKNKPPFECPSPVDKVTLAAVRSLFGTMASTRDLDDLLGSHSNFGLSNDLFPG